MGRFGGELIDYLASPPPRRVGRICPNDGHPLRIAGHTVYCPFDGWRGRLGDGEPVGPHPESNVGAGYGLTPYGSGPYGQ